MPVNSQYSVNSNNAALDARTARLNNGYLRVYSLAQPATAAVAITNQVLLAELRFGNPAFAPAAASAAVAAALAAATILATGVATWFRCLQSDGATVECDGSVGTAAANLIVGSTNFQQGADAVVSSLTLTAPVAGT